MEVYEGVQWCTMVYESVGFRQCIKVYSAEGV